MPVRVVGLPSEAVEIRDGVLSVDGEPRRELYVNYRLNDGSFFGPRKVRKDRVFAPGDNRANSRGSRSFGAVADEDLAGKVVLRFWPTGCAGAPWV